MTTRLLTYGPGPAQFAELSVPDVGPRGVAVVIHGGFWKQVYDISLARPLAADLVQRGWAALAIEYRRVGAGGGVPDTLDDVSAAVDTLAETDIDTSRVVTIGHSAGGHLAAWAAGRHRLERWESARVRVTGVIAQAGVLDLAAALRDDLGSGAAARFLGDQPDGLALADPTRHLPLDVPVWAVHARDDEDVPFSQSEAYVHRARCEGAEATLLEVEGGHFGHIDPTHPAWTDAVAGVLASL